MKSISPELLLGPEFKGFPLTAAPCTAGEIGARGWNILADDLPFPIAVLKRTALEHNIAWMQDYVERKGVLLAPHGKTTMSPELFAAQMVAGAWGITFATAYQASVGVATGVRGTNSNSRLSPQGHGNEGGTSCIHQEPIQE